MRRKIFGTTGGAVAAILIILLVELIGEYLYPVSLELDASDPASLAAWMDSVPLPSKLIVVTGWLLGAFAGAWLALRISDWRWSGRIVTGLVIAGGIANLIQLPHPLWMQICAVAFPSIGGWLATRLHRRPYPGEPLLG